MSRLKLPLYSKILLWFLVNLLVLALLGFGFLRAQFKLGLDWMLSGEPGDRIAAIGDGLTQELSRIPEGEWPARLDAYDRTHGVTFALFANTGEQLFGAQMDVPAEVMPRLIDRRDHAERPPPRRPQGPMMKRPDDAPPKPRFMLRAGNPSVYWAGIHLDLVSRSDRRPMTLLMKSGSITGGGLFFDLWPWLGLAVVALAVSALIWIPFVRGITGFISALNSAAGRIARGKFDERISQSRNDDSVNFPPRSMRWPRSSATTWPSSDASPLTWHTSCARPLPACRWRSAWSSNGARRSRRRI